MGKFSLLEVVVYICLPQFVTDVMNFLAALSHYATHRIDVCLYKVAWWWMYPPMCVRIVSYIFIPSGILGLIHVILFLKLIISVRITLICVLLSVVELWLYCYSSMTSLYASSSRKNSPNHRWSSYSITLQRKLVWIGSGISLFHRKEYNGKYNASLISDLDGTIGWSILL